MSEPKKREMGERMMRLVDAIERLRGMPVVLVIGEKIVFLGSLNDNTKIELYSCDATHMDLALDAIESQVRSDIADALTALKILDE